MMSIAFVPKVFSVSPTWRQFQSACAYVLLAIGLGCVLYGVETLVLKCEHRFVENPADTMTRAVGLAHFSIGWLFLFTSPRLRNRASLSRLTFWTLFGVACCVIFALGGAGKNPLLLLAFYSFFFVHEACDEAHLFRASGEAPAATPGAERFVHSLCVSVSLIFIALVAGAQILREFLFARSALDDFLPLGWAFAIWCVFAVVALGAVWRSLRFARAAYGSASEAVSRYQPLFAVYAGLIGILFVGSLFGSIGANLVILLHGMTWLVYTRRRLSARPVAPTGVWSWLRQTPAGFLTLHVAVTALALLLFALRSHVWQRTGLVCDLVSKTWFPYWGIMHIAMSFWRTK